MIISCSSSKEMGETGESIAELSDMHTFFYIFLQKRVSLCAPVCQVTFLGEFLWQYWQWISKKNDDGIRNAQKQQLPVPSVGLLLLFL